MCTYFHQYSDFHGMICREWLCFFKREHFLLTSSELLGLLSSGKVSGLQLEILKYINTLWLEWTSVCGFVFILPVFTVFSFSVLPLYCEAWLARLSLCYLKVIVGWYWEAVLVTCMPVKCKLCLLRKTVDNNHYAYLWHCFSVLNCG